VAIIETATRTVQVTSEPGIDVAAAAKLIRLAVTFPCEVSLTKDDRTVNGKSIMGVLMLVVAKGSVITIRAHGERADEAVTALAQLVADGFAEADR
jgi:phosphocarrier protein HPr